jgi:hypothetical protein
MSLLAVAGSIGDGGHDFVAALGQFAASGIVRLQLLAVLL